MIKTRIVALAGLFTLPLLANDDDRWTGSADVGITLATGNSESLRTTAGLAVKGDLEEWEVLGEASAVYGEDDGVTSNERLEASFQLNRDLGGRFYAGLTNEFLYDSLAGIDWRFGISPVLGMRVIDEERIKLRVEAGPGYTWESRNDREEGYASLRLHQEAAFHLTKDTRLFQSVTAVFEAEDLNNVILTAEAGMESRLTGHWSLRVAGKAIHYGESSDGSEDDLLVTAGFGYNYLPADNDSGTLESAQEDHEGAIGEWVVTALLGGNYSAGNSEARALNVGIEVKREREDDEIAAGAFGTYGETDGVVSAEALAADAHYQRNFATDWFAGVRGDFHHDALGDLDWRFSFSPYIGRRLVQTKRSKLRVEAGPSAVFEQQGGSQDSYLGAYAALKAEHKISARTRLFGEASWLAESTEWSSYFLTSEAGIDQSLTEKLTLKLMGRSIYDSTPAAGRQRLDFQLVSALGITF